MHALIDADIICYEIGSLKNPEEDLPLPWPLIEDRIWERVNGIIEAVDADTYTGYLTGEGNYRNEIATILPYKGNRKRSERPFWFYATYNYLVTEVGFKVTTGYEADDGIAIDGWGLRDECVICSKDKDLDQVPGWHFNWDNFAKKGKGLYYVTDWEASRSLHQQLLTGDSVDNILGLFGVGAKSAYVRALDNCETAEEMTQKVLEAYRQRYGAWGLTAMMENAALLRLLKSEGEAEQWQEYLRKKGASSKADSSIVLLPH